MTAQNPRNKDMVNPSQIPIPNLDELDPEKLMAYLTEAGANQTFEDHATFIMKFANRFRNLDSSDERELLTEKFLVYVVGSSAPKMFHRINHSKYSQPYFKGIVALPTGSVEWIGEKVSSPNRWDFHFIKALHSDRGVQFLQRVQSYMVRPAPEGLVVPTDPHWRRLVEELPARGVGESDAYKHLFPNLWNLAPGSKVLYTQATYREFHQILCISLIGYRDSLDRLLGLKKPTKQELWRGIDAVCDYLTILHSIAHSAAAVDHISVLAEATQVWGGPTTQGPPLSRIVASSAKAGDREETPERGVDLEHESEEEGEEEGEEEEEILEDSADMDVTDIEGPPPTSPDTPYIRWLKLQAAYFGALNHIVALFQFDARLASTIELAIHPILYTGKAMAPLMPVVEDIVGRYGLGFQNTGVDKPAIEMVKESFEVMGQNANKSFRTSLKRMSRGSGFHGRVHCEAALVSRILEPTEFGLPVYDRSAIGVSKRCCPVCSAILEALSLREPINVLGSHRTTMPCALPDNLPPGWSIKLATALPLSKGSQSSEGSADSHPFEENVPQPPSKIRFKW
ncbi:hypothetical protein BD779DRAFT_1531317 [Infundibulicybe gibba]|nr:hypothetical protein BD779DRAFT_1531317 [Infundibulicybe gibba]